jgi:hypothetical protein
VQIEGDTQALSQFLEDGIVYGDALELLPRLPQSSIDLFFTSPPYADARSYSRIHPDHYVEWFLPFAEAMFNAARESGSLILNIKNRVAKQGPLKGKGIHTYTSWSLPSSGWAGVGLRLTYGLNPMQCQASSVHGPKIVLSMFTIWPVALNHILTWKRLEFHIKQTSRRSPGESWIDLVGETQKQVLGVIELRRIYEAQQIQEMW